MINELRRLAKSFSKGNIFEKAADEIEYLTSLVKELARDNGELCDYCKHHISCDGCELYEEGEGSYTIDGIYQGEMAYSCKDFNFGTCSKRVNTPCNGCFDNDCKGFEWEGVRR
jgi:hypothetical protein